MRRHTTAVILSIALFAPMLPGPADAAPAAAAVVKPIAFPVDGPVRYTADFGAPRSGHTHEGNDIMGRKLLPELAAVDGTVLRVKFDNLSAGGNSVTIKGADGWTYHYIHVNNDRPGTDDGQATRAQAFPAAIVEGATVKKGQVVAYMGDSGNAEGTAPHLHFEIRQPAAAGQYQGVAVDPYESLQRAPRLPGSQRWWLRRGPSGGQVEDLFAFGTMAGDIALLCDWDGDAIDEPVIVRGTTWYLRSALAGGTTVRSFEFGAAGATPLCGDLDGDGTDEPISVLRASWSVRTGFAAADLLELKIGYGRPTDVPQVGDWDGDGADDLAVFRRALLVPAHHRPAERHHGHQLRVRPAAGRPTGRGRLERQRHRRTRHLPLR